MINITLVDTNINDPMSTSPYLISEVSLGQTIPPPSVDTNLFTPLITEVIPLIP